MELELGLKLTMDDFNSADLLIAKNRGSPPLFSSTETDTMFILTSHLKGYKRGNIKIDINADGTRIAISVEKPVQQMWMLGTKIVKKEIEKRGFRKAFRIPTGVVLDKIKAKFNDEQSILTISMPKLVRGVIFGGGIEEVKEDEVAKGVSETVKVVADEVAEIETLQHEEYGGSSIEDREESDRNVERLYEASEIGRGKKYEDLTHEKVEPAGSEVTIPKETQVEEQMKKASPEAKTSAVENQLKDDDDDDDRGTKTVESTIFVPYQAIQQPELPSPSSVEKSQVVEEHAIEESKMQIQESKKQVASQGIQELKESEGNQEIDLTQTSGMEQLKDQCQHDKYQVVGRKAEIHGTENGIQEEESKLRSGSKSEEEMRALEKLPQEAKVDESAKPPPKKSKLCIPIMAGSAFLVSLIVIVIHLIKAKKQPSNIKAKKQ